MIPLSALRTSVATLTSTPLYFDMLSHAELRRLCPTPPANPDDECNSVTSMSSEEEAEDADSDSDAESSAVVGKRWKLHGPVMNWAETRRAHIDECFHVFASEGFMHQDERPAATARVMKCLLHVVTHQDHWARRGHMASPAFWACVFVMDSYSRRPEGYEVRNKSIEVLNHAKEAWTLDNMHKVLAGEKSQSFKDRAQSEEYLTNVPTGRGFGRAVTRAGLKLRKLGVHDLGNRPSVRFKKMQTLLELMQLAGLERPHERICNMLPPETHQLRMANSAREAAMERISAEWDHNIAVRSVDFLRARVTMLGQQRPRGPRAPSPISVPWHPANRNDNDGAVDIGDGTFAKAKPRPSAHACEDGEKVVTGPVALPSDDEEDKRDTKDDKIARLQGTLKPTPKTVRVPPLDTSRTSNGDRDARKAAKRARKALEQAALTSEGPFENAPAATPPAVDESRAVSPSLAMAPAPAPAPIPAQNERMLALQAQMAALQQQMAEEQAAAAGAAAAEEATRQAAAAKAEAARAAAAHAEAARQAAVAEPVASVPPSISENTHDSDSSELSDSDESSFDSFLQEEDQATEGAYEGPREKTGDEGSELVSSALEGGSSDESDSEDDMAFINANQQEAASAEVHEQASRDAEETAEEKRNSEHARKRLERSTKARIKQIAINEGRCIQALSNEELKLLAWRDALDPDLLDQGIIQVVRKKRATPFHIQMRRRKEAADKVTRREARRKMADARAEIKHLQAIERAENKEEARKRVEVEIKAKKERRRVRDENRIQRANRKLTCSINKVMQRARATKERAQEKARKRLATAQKYGKSTLVHFGGTEEDGSTSTKFTLFVAPPRPEKESKAPKLPERNGYAVFNLSCQQYERLDKHGIETPVEMSDPYKRVSVDLPPQSNGTKSTRGAAALRARQEREAALKRERDDNGSLPMPPLKVRLRL